jgi:hypothetical protein
MLTCLILEITMKLDYMFTKNKKLATTACMRNSGFSPKSKVSAFNKSQYQSESEVLFNPLLLIHARR